MQNFNCSLIFMRPFLTFFKMTLNSVENTASYKERKNAMVFSILKKKKNIFLYLCIYEKFDIICSCNK